MVKNGGTRPVACTLTDEEKANRPAAVQRTLTSAYLGFDEREDGVTIRFDGTDEPLRAVARFTANELQCCSFAGYAISVSPPYEETVLTITGPDGTKQLFRDGLIERLEADGPSAQQP